MNFKRLLEERYNSELLRIEKLKKINLQFEHYTIDWKKLKNSYYQESLKKHEYKLIPPYCDLSLITGPVVYYYEILKGDPCKIWTQLWKYKSLKERACPQMIKPDFGTSILYVGSETKDFARRTTEHMGLVHRNTGGLQLLRWTPGLNIKLGLHYSRVKKEHVEAIRHVEAALANHLNPLVGRKEK